MTQIEYVDDEAPEVVQQIDEVLAENGDTVTLVAVCSSFGLNLLTLPSATRESLEEARMQLSGLLEHFDELVEAAAKNAAERDDSVE